MKLEKENCERLGVYFFYDKEGIVDDFVIYFLGELKKTLKRLVVVCNGTITAQGKERLSVYTNEVIERENKGLDVWAYKTALEYIGWKSCKSYDEVVLCNSTIMGPVYPFSEMFLEMQSRDVDFWGITKTHEVQGYDFGCNPYGYLPEHIQSYFIVYRQSLLKSKELKQYWDTMPMIRTYEESIGLYESSFTKKFEDLGFRWQVYVNTDTYKGIVDQPLMFYPLKLIEEQKCPIFKRRLFFHDYGDTLSHTAGQPALLLYDYLARNKLYDVGMIWENLLRCYNLAAIARQLHLNYTLSTAYSNSKNVEKIVGQIKIALCMHLFFSDLLEESFKLAKTMPAQVDIFITTDSQEKKKKLEHRFKQLKTNKVEVRLVENRGRDVSALLIGLNDVIKTYDLVCFSHDKKTTQSSMGSVGESFAYQCYANILYNRNYVENIIELFDKQPRLGMLVPPPPMHGEYRQLYGRNWTINYENTVKLCERLNITVPMSPNEEPLSPFGSVFWFRTKAMKKLFEHEWNYTDFCQEPMAVDGTISHAVERSYSFAAQSEGYYSAVVMSDLFERIEYTNLTYALTSKHEEQILQARLNDMYESTSWKISKPVRIIGEFLKSFSRL